MRSQRLVVLEDGLINPEALWIDGAPLLLRPGFSIDECVRILPGYPDYDEEHYVDGLGI